MLIFYLRHIHGLYSFTAAPISSAQMHPQLADHQSNFDLMKPSTLEFWKPHAQASESHVVTEMISIAM